MEGDGTLEVSDDNNLYYKAVHRTADPDVYESLYETTWRLGIPCLWESNPVLYTCGFHACKHPAAPFLDRLGFGYDRQKDVLLVVRLEGGEVLTDGITWVAAECTPVRVMSNEEWGVLVKGESVLTNVSGTKYFLVDGALRYDDVLPSVVYHSRVQVWIRHNKIHRDGDKPAVINPGEYMEWRKDGVLHRDFDLPASVSASHLAWYKKGRLHRVDDETTAIGRCSLNKPALVLDSARLEFYKKGTLSRIDYDFALASSLLKEHWHDHHDVTASSS